METLSKEDLQHNQPRKRKISGNGQFNAKKRAIFAIGLMILLLLGGLWINKNSTAYAVFINDQETLVFENKMLADQAVQDFLTEKSQEIGKTVTTKDKIEVKKIKIDKDDQVLAADQSLMLEQQLNMLVSGAALVIDGVEKAVVDDKKTAENLISKIKNTYTPSGDNWKVVKVDLKEKVQIIEKDVPMKEIIDADQAFQLLTLGAEKLVTHTVEEGESLWSIAKANNMKMEDLEEANPDFNPDKLQIGDEIKLVKLDPLIHVTTVAEYTEVKSVPYTVKVESDNNMLRGKEKIKQPGKEGTKEFKYLLVKENGTEIDKQFIEGTVLTEPVDKVVVKGSKMVLASRGSGGSGDLRWPIRGQITSRFGSRGRGFHTGLDINGNTGDPIYAAEGGTVTFVGSAGNYGKLIRISHGNGIETWYAHLSAYGVSSGKKIDRGNLIGRVGSTGRSTGSHLHFEVRINGNPVNPLKYLN